MSPISLHFWHRSANHSIPFHSIPSYIPCTPSTLISPITFPTTSATSMSRVLKSSLDTHWKFRKIGATSGLWLKTGVLDTKQLASLTMSDHDLDDPDVLDETMAAGWLIAALTTVSSWAMHMAPATELSPVQSFITWTLLVVTCKFVAVPPLLSEGFEVLEAAKLSFGCARTCPFPLFDLPAKHWVEDWDWDWVEVEGGGAMVLSPTYLRMI